MTKPSSLNEEYMRHASLQIGVSSRSKDGSEPRHIFVALDAGDGNPPLCCLLDEWSEILKIAGDLIALGSAAWGAPVRAARDAQGDEGSA